MSHKNFVSDIQFIPPGVKVEKKHTPDGRMNYCLSISEDGIVNVWDSRLVEKELLRNNPDFIWKPAI